MSDTVEIVVAFFCGIGSISMLVVEWYIIGIYYYLKDIKELLKKLNK